MSSLTVVHGYKSGGFAHRVQGRLISYTARQISLTVSIFTECQ